MTKILGIDPGKLGAVALITKGDGIPLSLVIRAMPFDGKHLDYRAIHEMMRKAQPDIVYMENVWGRFVGTKGGGMGFNASNSFMENVGALKGIIAGYVEKHNTHLVVPSMWKRTFDLLKKPKDESRATFAMLWPDHAYRVKRKKDDGIAEAGLIATHGAIRQGLIRMVQG